MPIEYEPCSLCQNHAEYSCSHCGELVCANDARIRVICTNCLSQKHCEYRIRQAVCDDLESLEALVTLFWGDPMQLMFDQHFKVTEHPAIIAETNDGIGGFIFYTPFRKDWVLIIALGVLPQFQGCGIGRDLVAHVEKITKEQGRQRLFVVTTNDNLPALAFYQRVGFQLFEVIPNVVSQKLGGTFPGFAHIPIRDELRLRKQVI